MPLTTVARPRPRTARRHRATGAVEAAARLWGRPWFPDVAVVALYVLGGLYVTALLWLQPDRYASWWNDQILFEWFLEHAAYSVAHLDNPLFTTRLNAPDGVNVLGNTSVLGLGIPLAPVTLLFGGHTTLLMCLLLSFAGTATGWYLVLSRSIGTSRAAAAVGGALAGFAPGLLSQAQGHLHMTAQFLVPAMVWAVLRLGPGRWLRGGIVLGLLVTWQVFIGEEVLALTALGLGTVFVAYAAFDREAAGQRLRPLAAGLGVASATAAALLAYPLWFQFFGPRHYSRLPFDTGNFPLDVKSYFVHSRYSIAGHVDEDGLAPNPTEENSFFGLALVLLCAVIVVWLWRRPLVRPLAVAAALFGLLSLGREIEFAGRPTGIPGPYRLVEALPLVDHIVPARFALVLIPIISLLVALSVDQVAVGLPAPARVRMQRIWLGAVAAVLLPLAPLPIKAFEVTPVPAFLTSGEWRSYVPEGRTVVPVVPSGPEALPGMLWSARTGLAFPVTGGWFIGPAGPDDPTGAWSASPPRPTASLLAAVAARGGVPDITDRDRQQAVEDLRHWRAAIVVLGERRHQEELRATLDELLGPGEYLSGAWVWDVRDLVDAQSSR